MSLKNKIQTEINQAIEAELFPGAAIGYILPGGKQEVVVGGHYTTSESSPIVTADSIYDLASITKSIPTASLALYLIDRGELSLDDKVIYFLPQLTGEFMDEITVRHLLRFEIEYGFSLSKNKDKSAEEILEIIFTTDLPTPPGTQYVYTNAAAVLLGLVVEKVAGEGLDKLAEKIFFKPLGMSRTRFRPLEKFTTEEIAPSEIDVWRGKALRGEVHDESAYVLSSIIAPGSAGLFSTTSDLLKFMQMLLLGGEFAGRKYFSPKIINRWRERQDVGGFNHAGLGWDVAMDYMGEDCGRDTFGKTGFTGTSFVCDPERQAGVVILSNATYPHRPTDRQPLIDFRSRVADLVWESI